MYRYSWVPASPKMNRPPRGEKLPFVSLCLAALMALANASPAAAPAAKPFLSPIFGDNMVLQRDKPCALWGWAKPGGQVSVSLGQPAVRAVADAEGKWQLTLPAHPAGGPHEISIAGAQTLTLHNVMFGDVWICSGQSNMEFGMGMTADSAAEIAAASNPNIRLFAVPKQTALTPVAAPANGRWDICKPETVRVGAWNGFSAVAYFFGRELQQDLKVPIGLIQTAWGGTPAEAWTSESALKDKMPDFGPKLSQLAEARAAVEAGTYDYAKVIAGWYQKVDPGENKAAPEFDASGWKTMVLPRIWEQSGDPQLARFDGLVWFRREVDLPAEAAGKAGVLHLGPVDNIDTTWVNGALVGGMDNLTLPRKYNLPAGVLKAGRNVIAVRVLDYGGGGGIPGTPNQMSLEISNVPAVALAGPWQYQIAASLAQTGSFPVRIPGNANYPTELYNGMIAPLVLLAMKGVIWYQGEANGDRSYQYRKLLPTMIEDWRQNWGQGQFPFLIVQLANFTASLPQPAEAPWAELREAQWMTAKTVPNTGLATAIDVGEAADIHPTNKQEVGHRLALAARALVYQEKIPYSGPAYDTMKVEGNAIRLNFTNTNGGWVAKDGKPLTGFAIAGANHQFVWADAEVDRNSVVVSSPQVPQPIAVRYAWANNPVCNLGNGASLPALPFRTDDWPGLTLNNK